MLWKRPRFWQIIGLVLLLAVAIAFVVLAVTAKNTPPTDDFTPPAAVEVVEEPVTAAFIGDSYTQGVGASVPANQWVEIVARANEYAAENLGRGGTGYLTTSDLSGCGLEVCPNYLSMVEEIPAGTDVVIIAGGRNDAGAYLRNAAGVDTAVTATYEAARVAFPEADIVAVGPSDIGEATGPVLAIDRAVRAAAEAVGARYISMLEPPVLSPELLSADGQHPNDAGHAAIAARYLAGIPPAV